MSAAQPTGLGRPTALRGCPRLLSLPGTRWTPVSQCRSSTTLPHGDVTSSGSNRASRHQGVAAPVPIRGGALRCMPPAAAASRRPSESQQDVASTSSSRADGVCASSSAWPSQQQPRTQRLPTLVSSALKVLGAVAIMLSAGLATAARPAAAAATATVAAPSQDRCVCRVCMGNPWHMRYRPCCPTAASIHRRWGSVPGDQAASCWQVAKQDASCNNEGTARAMA